ncbi:MAG: pantoate--beta-alanine ligase [Phycisphaeraceae bacterium]|nr:pantoate--beta-alanine ligase [Phycisphaeraceae bacterium]
MRIVRKIQELNAEGCVLVPTMGALHEGHLSLVHRAREVSDTGLVVVSIFVNPTQFNARVDLDAYPRDLERDLNLLDGSGVDVVFCPSVEEMYPPDAGVPVPSLPPVATEPALEDAGRPGHFAGVCQVVSRLFDVCSPSQAVFGEKDWQQLQVVRAMVRMQGRAIEIIAGPIVREQDGLAMSSRNSRLDVRGRERALSLHRAIEESGRCASVEEAERVMHETLVRSVDAVHYATVRDAVTLMPAQEVGREMRALVCAEVGGVRLLDNGPWRGQP